MPLSSCDDDRLSLIAKIQASFAQARELAKEGALAEALEAYLFAFDNGHLVPGWGGVSLSYIPSEIAKLGDRLPAALQALRQRRDAREKMLSEGEEDPYVIMEWQSLNRYLNEQKRELKLLRQLKAKGPVAQELEKSIVVENYDSLLRDGEYKTLADCFEKFGRKFLFSLFHFDCEVLLPSNQNKMPKEMWKAKLAQNILADGQKLYELALATKRWEHADEVARRVLSYCPTMDSFEKLEEVALRLNCKARLKKLRAIKEEILPAEVLVKGSKEERKIKK